MEQYLDIQSKELTNKVKDIDISKFEYPGYFNRPAYCKVEGWKLSNNRIFILFTDLGMGTSVTNAPKSVITTFYNHHLKGKYNKENCLFAETYNDYREETVDVIIPKWENDEVVSVEWKNLATKINEEKPKW